MRWAPGLRSARLAHGLDATTSSAKTGATAVASLCCPSAEAPGDRGDRLLEAVQQQAMKDRRHQCFVPPKIGVLVDSQGPYETPTPTPQQERAMPLEQVALALAES